MDICFYENTSAYSIYIEFLSYNDLVTKYSYYLHLIYDYCT
ncbi:MAG: hypothetical protein JWR54_2885 [Mucilaginibacter sp.]|nr:hypothetical protein [Mucilaginibacter sp.]